MSNRFKYKNFCFFATTFDNNKRKSFMFAESGEEKNPKTAMWPANIFVRPGKMHSKLIPRAVHLLDVDWCSNV